MGFIGGVHLLPSTGEFTYDTIAYEGARLGTSLSPINTFFAPGGSKTDYSYSIDQLEAQLRQEGTGTVTRDDRARQGRQVTHWWDRINSWFKRHF